ncbi:MAG: 3'(2'),5'-bisphosphate nucleotidase CysQ [Phycisphaerales bacterium]|nr:MAG: 3'(2'),5'-bisphosphate nucleotidase CysQ [Phycisphaerales bacterium]
MLEQELEAVKQATRQAGEAILSIAEEHYKTAASQADRSVVTKADIEADKILQRHLRDGFGDYGWLSEETRDDGRRFQCERVWIVDPMDGTREFVMKVPEFVVSVALAEGGEVVLGVILNPSTGDLFEAVTGAGTKLNGQSVLCDHEFDGRPKVEVSRSDIEKGYFTAYDGVLELSPCGSIAYKMARLAAGKSDGALSVTPKNEWDIAAGVLLVAEAGGRVTDLAGNVHRFNESDTLVDGVVAANQSAYGIIKRVVDERRHTQVDE